MLFSQLFNKNIFGAFFRLMFYIKKKTIIINFFEYFFFTFLLSYFIKFYYTTFAHQTPRAILLNLFSSTPKPSFFSEINAKKKDDKNNKKKINKRLLRYFFSVISRRGKGFFSSFYLEKCENNGKHVLLKSCSEVVIF